MIRRSLFKFIAALLIIILQGGGLFALSSISAYFRDVEELRDNTTLAGSLDFSLFSLTSNFVPAETAESIQPGDEVSRTVALQQQGSLLFQYTASTLKIEGSDDFCRALQLKAELAGELKYTGPLLDFNFPALEISLPEDSWNFTVSLPAGPNFLEQICRFKFVFHGWQTNFIEPGGFSDTEEIESWLIGGAGLKINKVYYDVEPPYGNEGENEWVELYNPTDEAIDISHWIIEDNNASDILPGTTTIPALGFAVITGNQTTFGYWQVPDEVVKIVLDDGKIGNGLGNANDRVILKTAEGIEVDAVSYGEDTYAFVPACDDIPAGHILSRFPNGFDTNTASDWRDIGLPSVQVIFPNGGEVLYVGRTYTLWWSASNPNGPDSDLSIALWYSGDSGNSWANIATSTENDGQYNWRVPLFLDGYYVPSSRARLKVVATGPENFMVQDWDISDSDFCPPIDYGLLTTEEKIYLIAMGVLEALFEEEPAVAAPAVEQEAESDEPIIPEAIIVAEDITAAATTTVSAATTTIVSAATTTATTTTAAVATTTEYIVEAAVSSVESAIEIEQAVTSTAPVFEPWSAEQATSTEPILSPEPLQENSTTSQPATSTEPAVESPVLEEVELPPEVQLPSIKPNATTTEPAEDLTIEEMPVIAQEPVVIADEAGSTDDSDNDSEQE